MSSPVSKIAWSWRLPPLPKRPDCHWQKLLRDWSAWWLMVKPSCKWITETTEQQGSHLLTSGCQVKCFLWVYWPGLLPITTSWPPQCWYLTLWCRPWKDWRPALEKPVSRTSIFSQGSWFNGTQEETEVYFSWDFTQISSPVLVKERASSPCSWQWGRRWWRCLCHVSPASSGLPPPGSPRSDPPPYWKWWGISLPSLTHPSQVWQTRQA